jgi:hypothetical protein
VPYVPIQLKGAIYCIPFVVAIWVRDTKKSSDVLQFQAAANMLPHPSGENIVSKAI